MNKVFTFVCYILCGLALSIWYQAKVNFIIVGLCAAVLCILEKLFLERPLSKLPDLVHVFFAAENLAEKVNNSCIEAFYHTSCKNLNCLKLAWLCLIWI